MNTSTFLWKQGELDEFVKLDRTFHYYFDVSSSLWAFLQDNGSKIRDPRRKRRLGEIMVEFIDILLIRNLVNFSDPVTVICNDQMKDILGTFENNFPLKQVGRALSCQMKKVPWHFMREGSDEESCFNRQLVYLWTIKCCKTD